MTKNIHGGVKSAPLDTTTFNPETGEIGPVCASAPVFDRLDEIIDTIAWEEPAMLADFLRLGTMPLFHDLRRPVGRWTSAEARPGGLYLRGRVGTGWPDADNARAMIRDGALRALSVGFTPRDGFRDRDGRFHYTKLSLLECSLCTVPINQEATFALDEGGVLKAIELVERHATSSTERAQMAKLRERLHLVALQMACADLQWQDRERSRHRAELASTLSKLREAIANLRRLP